MEYVFVYILASLFLYFLINRKKYKKFIPNYFLSALITLLILTPHFIWLFENNFVTISYGLNRSALTEVVFINHFKNPIIFFIKQIIILIPFFIMISILLKNYKIKLNVKNRESLFLLFITLVPILLVIITSVFTGAKIRTMWMTPFYLFLGTLFIDIFKKNIDFKKIKNFYLIFLFFFILSPSAYLGISILDDTKRTDYPGKEISRLVQNKWDENFVNEIKIVVGDEWSAGNLSYHLDSRPMWIKDLKNKASKIKDDQGVIYAGNPEILKKICPGVFGKIAPIGYCMIGKR